jgi:hypothetical protein
MATPAENLDSAITAISSAIAANPTAINYSIDGQSVSHGDLVKKLAELTMLRSQLEGPVQSETQGYC